MLLDSIITEKEEKPMKCRCPHCGSKRKHLDPDTLYTCGNCNSHYISPPDRERNAFSDLRMPGEDAIDAVESLLDKWVL